MSEGLFFARGGGPEHLLSVREPPVGKPCPCSGKRSPLPVVLRQRPGRKTGLASDDGEGGPRFFPGASGVGSGAWSPRRSGTFVRAGAFRVCSSARLERGHAFVPRRRGAGLLRGRGRAGRRLPVSCLRLLRGRGRAFFPERPRPGNRGLRRSRRGRAKDGAPPRSLV